MKKYRIGQFAKAMGVSVDFLRYYESHGLIASKQDEKNRYHYYDFSQSLSVSRILYLRSMGFSVKDIRAILLDSNRSKTIQLYHDQKRRLQESIAEAQYAVKTLTEFEQSLRTEGSENWYVTRLEPLYILPHTKGEEYYTDAETLKRVAEWRDYFPYTFDLDYWPRRVKNNVESSFPVVYHGLAVACEIAEEIGLCVEPPVFRLPGGRCLEYHISSPLTSDFGPSNRLTQDKYREVFDLVRDKNFLIKGDMLVRFITIYQEDRIYDDHSIIYLPIG